MSPSSTVTNEKESSPLNLLYLPEDLLLNCLARLSRWDYPTLFLVSKKFHFLLVSLELCKTRALSGRIESCLYLCLESSHDYIPRWFTLRRRPTQTPNPNPKPSSGWLTPCFRPCNKKEKSTNNVMVSVPTRNFSPDSWLSLTAIDSNIYKIGSYMDSRIFFMDCKSHTWQKAPSMLRPKKYPRASVLDGKLYVMDGDNSLDIIEFFDPKTQIWQHVPSPSAEIRGKYIFRNFVMEGNLYMFGDKRMVYKPKENRWDEVEGEMHREWYYNCYCVINNVLSRYGSYRWLQWYDSKAKTWRVLMGLIELPKLPKSCERVTLVDYGGKIAVLWEKNVCMSSNKMIWCAEIKLERRNEQEICAYSSQVMFFVALCFCYCLM